MATEYDKLVENADFYVWTFHFHHQIRVETFVLAAFSSFKQPEVADVKISDVAQTTETDADRKDDTTKLTKIKTIENYFK